MYGPNVRGPDPLLVVEGGSFWTRQISLSARNNTGRNTTELSCVSSARANATTERVLHRDWPLSHHRRNQSRLRQPKSAPIASASAPTQAMASMSDGCTAKKSAVRKPKTAEGPPEGGPHSRRDNAYTTSTVAMCSAMLAA